MFLAPPPPHPAAGSATESISEYWNSVREVLKYAAEHPSLHSSTFSNK